MTCYFLFFLPPFPAPPPTPYHNTQLAPIPAGPPTPSMKKNSLKFPYPLDLLSLSTLRRDASARPCRQHSYHQHQPNARPRPWRKWVAAGQLQRRLPWRCWRTVHRTSSGLGWCVGRRWWRWMTMRCGRRADPIRCWILAFAFVSDGSVLKVGEVRG